MSAHVVSGFTAPAGRFAPSPSGDLHVGNIRSGVLAFLCAHQAGYRFYWRVEDLDRVQTGAAQRQLADFASLGLTPDPPVLYQSHRTAVYQRALNQLLAADLVYECYCSRKDIQQAASAPHAPPGAYPGTCRNLSEKERQEPRARLAAQGRVPALRLRTDHSRASVHDAVVGEISAPVDDFVLRRTDGVFAYNLAAVVDDGETGVIQVVRGDDLASSAPRQAYLAQLLGYPVPTYVHVPLVLGPTGKRLAKRDGAVTFAQVVEAGMDVWAWMGTSLGFSAWAGVDDALAEFDLAAMTTAPATFTPPA